MPTTKSQTIWPTRVAWPRHESHLLPALAAASRSPRPYLTGRSRFAISPIHLTLDQLLFLITAALLSIGIIMVASADARPATMVQNSSETAQNVGNSPEIAPNITQISPNVTANLGKNVVHAMIALLVMTLLWRLDYRWFLGKNLKTSPATFLILLTCLLLVLVLRTPLGREINGARRWFALGPIGFQPSELAKLGLVLFISAYAVHQGPNLQRLFKGFLPLVLVFAVVAALIIKEDFGTTALVCVVCFILLAMGGSRWWHLGLLMPPAAVGVWAILFRDKTSFRYRRLMAFWDPLADPKGVGYHPLQSLLTIMSGGFWGRGLGNGIQKMGYLPEDNTDFIFAVICEELGFFGALMVIALFAAFVIVGWRIASRCNHLFGKMIAFGITAIIGLQAAMNIAVVTVSMPTKGIALPLISSGGTGWIMMAAAVGVLMSIERINRLEERTSSRLSIPAPTSLGFPIVPHGRTQGAA